MVPLSPARRRHYVHGDAHESRLGTYYCAVCDIFAPREHFEDKYHTDRNSKRFFHSLKAWRAREKRLSPLVRRPANAGNMVAESAHRARKLAQASASKFYRWLKKQVQRDDPIGDLANDAKSDSTFPVSSNSFEEITHYLMMRDACSEAIVALREAWDEFTRKRRPRSALALTLRFEVFRRDDYRCQVCGASAQDGSRLEVDHPVALSKGGSDALRNLWTLCFKCNRGKGTRDL